MNTPPPSDSSRPSDEAPKAPLRRAPQLADERKRARNRAQRIKRVALIALTLAGALLIVWAFLPRPTPVDLAEARRRPLRITIDEDGITRVKDRYVISAPLLANVARIEHSPGDDVTAETVVARLLPLDPPLLDPRSRAEAEARVQAARAAERQAQATVGRVRSSLDFAQREVERLRALRDRGAVPQQDVDRAELQARTLRDELASAEFAARVAEHQLALARAALGAVGRRGPNEADPMEIRAPIAGRVLRVIRESEGVVQPGTPLLELGDPTHLEIVVDLLTSDALQIHPGTRGEITGFGGDTTLEAHVQRIEPSAFTRVSALGVEEQRVNVILDLDSPHDTWKRLGDGYRVEVRLIAWEGQDLLTVPASAIFRHRETHALYRLEDGRARLRQVRLGRRNDQLAQILEGLEEGDQVIEHPGDAIRDGVRIESR